MKVVCSGCGSVYELSSNKIPVRDKDTLECEVCNTQIYSWNEAKIWYAKLVEKKQGHIQQ
ncbi:MAG: hypothetical protein JNL72_02580 [Flavipsychrobacter sp.]|nr:hypothetical protein [Flavipsychrobacter sp.]